MLFARLYLECNWEKVKTTFFGVFEQYVEKNDNEY